MAETRIVIVSSQSLFAQGIASRLRQYLQIDELEIVAPRGPAAMAQIAAARPSVLILDVSDSREAQPCSLDELLSSFPTLKVICLDPQQERIHVVTSEQLTAASVRDLAKAIDEAVR